MINTDFRGSYFGRGADKTCHKVFIICLTAENTVGLLCMPRVLKRSDSSRRVCNSSENYQLSTSRKRIHLPRGTRLHLQSAHRQRYRCWSGVWWHVGRVQSHREIYLHSNPDKCSWRGADATVKLRLVHRRGNSWPGFSSSWHLLAAPKDPNKNICS